MQPSDKQIIEFLRTECEQDFRFFARYFFKARTGSRFIWSEHHEQITCVLMAVHRGEVTNQRVHIPPRYSKTELCVVLFVAWCYAKNPKCKFIHLSYADTLVQENSQSIKDVMQSQEFLQLWPNIQIRDNKDSKKAWDTVQGGTFYATSAGGQVTGFGAGRLDEVGPDGAFVFAGCFPHEQIITTDRGPMMIGDVVQSRAGVRVLSFNHDSGKTEFMEIERYWTNPPNEIIEVHLSDGSRFRCTPDHEVFTNEGWVEASALTGKHVVLEYTTQALELVLSEPKPSGNLLSRLACIKDSIIAQVVHGASVVPLCIRKVFGHTGPCFPQLDLSNNPTTNTVSGLKFFDRQSACEDFDDGCPRELGARPSFKHRKCSVLERVLHVLRLCAPLEITESVVRWVAIKVSPFFPLVLRPIKGFKNHLMHVSRSDLASHGKRDSVVAMLIGGLLKYATRYRVGPPVWFDDHSVKASDSSLITHLVSPLISRNRSPVFISSVGHVDVTYCLQIRKNNNFILHESNVLVSNCLLVDDPLKPDDARHDTVREAINGRWETTIKSRRNSPRTPTLLIMQRVHEKDFAAHVAGDTSERWESLELPALIDEGLPTERALWPAKHSLEKLKAMRDQRNDRGEVNPQAAQVFSAQYQQRPTPAGGGTYKESWWRFYGDREAVIKRCTSFWITGDTAFTADPANDATALQLWGAEGRKRLYLLDRRHGRWEFPELQRTAVEFLRDNPHAKRIYIEAKASGLSLIQSINRARTPEMAARKVRAVPWKPKDYNYPDDKVGRAQLSAVHVFNGSVWLPSPDIAPWVWDFVDEHSSFTLDDTHAHDDDVDAQTMAVSIWTQQGGGRT